MKNIIITFLLLTALVPALQAQTCGTTNIALNKPVTVSSSDVNHTKLQAVDGDTTTDWWSMGNNIEYIYVDLGQTYNICKVVVYFSGPVVNYSVDISSDATNWTAMETITGNAANTVTHNVTGTGRYVRINMTLLYYSWSTYGMNELKIYNSPTNTPPSVSLTTPMNNAAYTTGNNVTLTASASDADGTVSKVEFFEGANKLGEATSSPYTYTWSNVTAGSYALTAKATDNSGATTTSSAKNITVSSASGWSLTGNGGTTPGTNFIGTTDSKKLVLKTNNTSRMTILSNGAVAIGTDTITNAEAKLAVNGAIYTTKLKVTQSSWADYVFDKDYKLLTLDKVEAFIKKNSHLPGVPTTAQVQQHGTDVADIQATLLKKIEELTLYMIEQNKKNEALAAQVKQQNDKLTKQQQQLQQQAATIHKLQQAKK